jgi:hypothetical protein
MRPRTTRWITEHISITELPDGRYFVFNGVTGDQHRFTEPTLIDYLQRHVTSPNHVPLGDYLHKFLKGLGIKGCLPCAERQARLNRVLGRRSG